MSITFRTLHMIGFGALLGGHAFTVDTERLLPCLWLAILSGFGLIALELHAEGLAGGLMNLPPTTDAFLGARFVQNYDAHIAAFTLRYQF